MSQRDIHPVERISGTAHMRYSFRPRRSETCVSPDPATNPDDRLPEESPRRKSTKRNITDCQKRDTTFRGRLGYACLNTLLRSKKPAAEATFCSRTCRIESIKKKGVEWVKDLGRKNVEDMLEIIEWNELNVSQMIVIDVLMYSSPQHIPRPACFLLLRMKLYGYSLAYCATLLAEVGALAEKYGHRLTVHPGQYTQLGSPREAVVRSSIRDLEYHCEMLDLMGVGPDGVIVIHGGGVYGDKEATLARIKETIRNVRDRLVLENDENWKFHWCLIIITDMLNPSPGLPPVRIMEEANEIFRRRGIKPKQHYRNGAVGIMERRAHSDRCQILPQGLPEDMDLMIEAKDKEQAVLQLYRTYDLYPVNHESLRPPKDKEVEEIIQDDIDT
ncbi:UV-endonuclease UvdE-domain-containing protein [Pisolithus microcarpus]|nr:UV-endonuclease UvdE-domain-containing protein [Pisolithus microcarpus]